MWMATLGITRLSLSSSIRRVSTPLSVLTATRPAKDSGLSSQLSSIWPPYLSVSSCMYLPLTSISAFSLILNTGLSRWLAVSMKPPKSPSGTLKAMTLERLRVTK